AELPRFRLGACAPTSPALRCLCASCPAIFFFQAEDGIRDRNVTGVQTCALPISRPAWGRDRVNHFFFARIAGFNPRAPRGGATRSEERRVGKEGRCRGWTEH